MVNKDVRSGAELRKRAAAVDKMRRSRYPCPKCGKSSVKRISNAEWKCRSCEAVFAGGAYSLSTPLGKIGNKALEALHAETKKG